MKSILMALILLSFTHLALAQKVISSAIGAGGATTVVDGKY